jgi:hypothetical protein
MKTASPVPFVDFLPSPEEASINLLRGGPPAGDVPRTVTVSWIEAPSARLAVDREAARRQPGLRIKWSIAGVPSPDPRSPRAPVEYVVWHHPAFFGRYAGKDPKPAVPPPPPPVAERVRALAATRYHLATWKDAARRIGAELGTAAVPDLLATMVHPPREPEDVPAWRWLVHVQHASALILSHVDAGWEGSRREAVLWSLIAGPLDWTGAAALLALTELVLDGEVPAPHALQWIMRALVEAPPSDGHWCHERALVSCGLRIIEAVGPSGPLPPKLRESLERLEDDLGAPVED